MAMIQQMDDLDRRIIGYLQIDGRAQFRAIAQVLDLPERTVSRRGQELLNSGAIRVAGLIERSSMVRKDSLILRIQCTPGTNTIVATALAALPESIFVYLITGKNECLTELFATVEELNEILLKFIPGIPGVKQITSFGCLRYFRTAAQWNPGILTYEELDQIKRDLVPRPIQEIELQQDDLMILNILANNGRATYEQIARACGLTEPTARRKTAQLLNSGALSIHAIVDPSSIGFPVECWIFVKCPPSKVSDVADAILKDNHVRYLASITGEYQILFEVAMSSRKVLGTYLEEIANQIGNIQALSSHILIEPFKRSGQKVTSRTD